MAAKRDVNIEMSKIFVDDSISSETSNLSGVDRLPFGSYNENGIATELCIDNSMDVQDSRREMCDDISPPGRDKIDNFINAPFIAKRRNKVRRNLISRIELKEPESEDEDIVMLESEFSKHFEDSCSQCSDMTIDSPPAENDNDRHCDLSAGIVKSVCKNSEISILITSGEYSSPLEYLHGNDDNDGDGSSGSVVPHSCKKSKKSKPCTVLSSGISHENGNSLHIYTPMDMARHTNEFNQCKRPIPSTPVRNAKSREVQGIHDFLGIHMHKERLLGSPVGRKLNFDTCSKSSTPKPQKEKMNSTEPGRVELQNTPVDLLLPRRCNSEAITRIDKSRLHLWVNPFSPAGRNIISDIRNVQEKTRRKRSNDSLMDDESPKKRKRSTSSRYESEFVELEEIGTGNHGCVYKCLNLINGMIYAVKVSKNKVRKGFALETAKNELYAHGVLEHRNIVRNYSSWVEDGYVYIQNEYCNKGNLESYMKDHPVIGNKARKLLYDLASGLRYMHSIRLVHLDVKPGNIFVNEIRAEIDDGCDSSEDESEVTHLVFKLGDFGHIIHLDRVRNLEEGDCRYMARELLNEDQRDLTKADIFSLALSVYEAAGGGGGVELPKNGDEWQLLRDGVLKRLPGLSTEMNLLLQSMTQPDLTKRPSAAEICRMLAPARKSEKLMEELKAKTQKIAVLEAKQRERNSVIKQLKAQSLKFIQASDDIHTPRCTEKLLGKQSKRYNRIHIL